MKFWVVLAMACALGACAQRRPPLPVLGDIPRFDLTAQNGQPFDSRTLAGKIWVADFIYTTCPGPCPRMTSQMRELDDVVKTLPDVRLVSFTIDPANDTPPVLAAYAKTHGASPIWYFLTGPISTLQTLDRDAFKLGDIDGTLQHSTRFVLVDRKGRIRAYYDSSEPSLMPKIFAGMYALNLEGT
jgi:protein SCO1/2